MMIHNGGGGGESSLVAASGSITKDADGQVESIFQAPSAATIRQLPVHVLYINGSQLRSRC